MSTRVLLAESDHILRQTVAHTLAAEKIQTVCADDGNAALYLLNETTPDLLIVEIALPDKNGFALCQYVRQEPEFQSLPVILLDSHFDNFNQNMAYNLSANTYLSKPIEMSELIEIVRRLLESKREARDGESASGGVAATRQRLPRQESYNSEVSNKGRESYEPQAIPTSLPEARLSNSRKHSFIVFCCLAVATILVAVGLAVWERARTSSIPTTQQQSSATEPSHDVAAEEPWIETTPRRETPITHAGATPPSEENVPPNVVRQSAGVALAQTGPPDSLKEQPPASVADTTRPAPRQDSPSVAAAKDSPGVSNVQPYTPVARPRRTSSGRSTTIGGHLKRSGREMKEAGEHFGSGAKHLGKSGGKAAAWAGKKVGRGVGRMAGALKKIF